MKGQLHLDSEGQTIAIVAPGVPWGVSTFDARTGAAGRELRDRKGNFARLFPLEKGAFGLQNSIDSEVTVWDAAGATTAVRFSRPITPSTSSVNASPNGRYVAVGVAPSSPGSNREFSPATPLGVIDGTKGKDVVAIDWHVVVQERGGQKVTVYDLPELPAPK